MPYARQERAVQWSNKGGDVRIDGASKGALLSSPSERPSAHNFSTMRGTLQQCKEKCDSIASCIGFGRQRGSSTATLGCWMKGRLDNVETGAHIPYDMYRKGAPAAPSSGSTVTAQPPSAPRPPIISAAPPPPIISVAPPPSTGSGVTSLPSHNPYGPLGIGPPPSTGGPRPAIGGPPSSGSPPNQPGPTGGAQSFDAGEATAMFSGVLTSLSPVTFVPDLPTPQKRALFYEMARRGAAIDPDSNPPEIPEMGEELRPAFMAEITRQLTTIAQSSPATSEAVSAATPLQQLHAMMALIPVMAGVADVVRRDAASQGGRGRTPQTAAGGGLLHNPVRGTPDNRRTEAAVAAQTAPPNGGSDDDDGLGAGAIAGIAVGAVVLVIAIIVLAIYLHKKKKGGANNKAAPSATSGEVAGETFLAGAQDAARVKFSQLKKAMTNQ